MDSGRFQVYIFYIQIKNDDIWESYTERNCLQEDLRIMELI